MTPDELDALEALATKATPGPRTARRLDLPPPGLTFFGPSHWNVRAADPNDPEAGPQFTTSGVHSAADAAFIAACDPDTIRRLILAAREPAGAGLREALERLADRIDSYCDHEDEDPSCLDSIHACAAEVRALASPAEPGLDTHEWCVRMKS